MKRASKRRWQMTSGPETPKGVVTWICGPKRCESLVDRLAAFHRKDGGDAIETGIPSKPRTLAFHMFGATASEQQRARKERKETAAAVEAIAGGRGRDSSTVLNPEAEEEMELAPTACDSWKKGSLTTLMQIELYHQVRRCTKWQWRLRYGVGKSEHRTGTSKGKPELARQKPDRARSNERSWPREV